MISNQDSIDFGYAIVNVHRVFHSATQTSLGGVRETEKFWNGDKWVFRESEAMRFQSQDELSGYLENHPRLSETDFRGFYSV